MPSIVEGNLAFCFGFDAIKYDDSLYYRKHFSKIQDGISAVDILAVDDDTAYLIEIKDYTHPDTANLTSAELIAMMANKVISTLAAVLPMRHNGSDEEKEIAGHFLKASQIRVVLHIEIPPPRSTLKQSRYNFYEMEQALRKKLKAIDAHPKIVSKKSKKLPWTVSQV